MPISATPSVVRSVCLVVVGHVMDAFLELRARVLDMPNGLLCVALQLVLPPLTFEVLVVGHLAGSFFCLALGPVHSSLGLVLGAIAHDDPSSHDLDGSVVPRQTGVKRWGRRLTERPGQDGLTAARSVASVWVRIRETCICEIPISAAISDCVRFSKKRRYRMRRSRAGSSRIAGATSAQPVASSNRSSISPSVSDGDCASSSGLPSRDAAVKACAASTASITSDSDSPIASAISANDGERPSVCARSGSAL